MQTVVDVGVGADGAQGGDGALHRPQQQAGLGLGRRAGVGQRARDARRGEGEQEGGNQGLLDDLGGAAGGDHLVVSDPLRQGVDVPVGGQVRGNHPQLGAGRGVLAVQGGGELEALVGQARAGGHHGGATGQQLPDDGCRDGAGGHTGDDGDVLGPAHCGVTGLRGLRRGLGDLGQDGGALGAVGQVGGLGLLGPPGGVIGHRLSQTHEALGDQEPAEGVQVGLAGAESGDVLTGRGPAVIDEDGALWGEGRGDGLDPSGAELGVQGGHGGPGTGGLVVGISRDSGLLGQPQGVQEGAGRGGQDALGAGDALGEGVQGRGVHHCASGTAGTRLGDAHTVVGGDGLDGGVDEGVHGARTGQRGRGAQGGQVLAAHRGALPGAQEQGGGHVGDPALPQSPGAGDAVGDTGGAHAGGAQEPAQPHADGLGEDRTEGLVTGSALGDRGGQGRHVGVSGTVDGGEFELGTQVHEELVATRGDSVGECLGGVRGTDLLGADARGVGQEHRQGVSGTEGEVVHRSAGGRRRRGGCGLGRGGGSLLGSSALRGSLGLSSRLLGGRNVEVRFGELDGRVGVGGQHPGLVAASVVHGDVAPGVLGQTQGVGGQVRQGRRIGQPHLDDVLDPQAALARGGQQDLLGLDPAHRRGELPGQELDEQDSGQLRGALRPGVPVGQDLFNGLGGHDLKDRTGEVLGQGEGPGHEVGNVVAHQARDVQVLGDELEQTATELRHAGAQHLGVEGHVDAGDEHEGVLAPAGLGLGAGVGGQGVQALDRAGHGVLDAGQVVVDDLEELAGGLGDRAHVGLDLVGLDARLVGAQGPHAVVRGAVGVTGHQRVHGGAALEDDRDGRLHGHDAPVGAQRRVLAQGVAGEGGALHQGTGLGQTRSGRHGDGGQGHLGELGEVEQALGVAVGDAAGGHLGGVVAHQVDDGEAQLGAGVGVGPLPDLPGGLGGVHLVQAHAGGLDALAGVDVGGGLGRRHGSAAGDDLAVDAADDLQDVAAADHQSGALHGDLDVVAQLDRTGHDVGPAGQDMARAVGRGGGRHLLGSGRQPHAVDERGLHTGHVGGVVGGVDRVEVTGDPGERGHVRGRGDGGAAQDAACGRGRLASGAAGELWGAGHGVAGGAAADGEALTHECHHGAVGGVGQLQAHVDDAAGAGLLQCGDPAGDVDRGAGRGCGLLELVEGEVQVDGVVQVDSTEQALDERHAVLDDAAQGGVDHRPAGAEQGVGHEGRGGQVRRQGVGGHRGVVVAQGACQGEGAVDGAEGLGGGASQDVRGPGLRGADLGQVVDMVARDGHGPHAGGGPQQVVHRLADALGVDQWSGTVPGAGQAQRHDEAAHGVDLIPAGSAVPVGVEADVEVVGVLGHVRAGDDVVGVVVQDGGRVDRQVAVPQDVGGYLDELLGVGHGSGQDAVGNGGGGTQAAGGLLLTRACLLEGLDGGGLEAAQQLADRLIDGGDAGNGDRTGDDAHLVSGVARVLGLPQGVGAPPAQDVGVDHGHEGHGLGVLAAQVDEPGGVDGLHEGGGGRRVVLGQCGQGGVGVDDGVVVGEERGDLAVVGPAQAGLDAVQQVDEAVVPALVGPVGAGGAAPLVGGDAQLGVAGGPLKVGHLLDVTEVGLGGLGQGVDHLLAACGHGGLVTGELLDEAGGPGRGVVDLVEVGAQVGQS